VGEMLLRDECCCGVNVVAGLSVVAGTGGVQGLRAGRGPRPESREGRNIRVAT